MSDHLTHPSDAELSAFALGALPADDAARVEQHVNKCAPCCDTIVSFASQDTFVDLIRQAGSGLESSCDTADAGSSRTLEEALPSALLNHSRYEVEHLVGRGGMGQVYKARHRMMDRAVALKVIHQEWVQKQEAINRFQREVKTAASLDHRNIVTAYDAEQIGDLHVLVMEFVDGADLSHVVKTRGALSVAEACWYVEQAAAGLQHAHDRGMVHRDIKPHNLIVTKNGIVKILDFGLASLAPQAAVEAPTSTDAGGNLTIAGAIMGTPNFISPEQAIDARAVDGRSDIYSLGMTLYYLLAGRVPFGEGTASEKLKQHAESEPTPLTELRDDVPAEVQDIVARMTAKAPDERFQSPHEVVTVLSNLRDQSAPASDLSPRQRRSVLKWIVGAALVGLIAAAGVFFFGYGDRRAKADYETLSAFLKTGQCDEYSGEVVDRLLRSKVGRRYLRKLDAENDQLAYTEGDFAYGYNAVVVYAYEDLEEIPQPELMVKGWRPGTGGTVTHGIYRAVSLESIKFDNAPDRSCIATLEYMTEARDELGALRDLEPRSRYTAEVLLDHLFDGSFSVTKALSGGTIVRARGTSSDESDPEMVVRAKSGVESVVVLLDSYLCLTTDQVEQLTADLNSAWDSQLNGAVREATLKGLSSNRRLQDLLASQTVKKVLRQDQQMLLDRLSRYVGASAFLYVDAAADTEDADKTFKADLEQLLDLKVAEVAALVKLDAKQEGTLRLAARGTIRSVVESQRSWREQFDLQTDQGSEQFMQWATEPILHRCLSQGLWRNALERTLAPQQQKTLAQREKLRTLAIRRYLASTTWDSIEKSLGLGLAAEQRGRLQQALAIAIPATHMGDSWNSSVANLSETQLQALLNPDQLQKVQRHLLDEADSRKPTPITLANVDKVRLLAELDRGAEFFYPGPGEKELTLEAASGSRWVVDTENFHFLRELKRNRTNIVRVPTSIKSETKDGFKTIRDGDFVARIPVDQILSPVHLAFSPDGSMLAAGSYSGQHAGILAVFDTRTGKRLQQTRTGCSSISEVHWNPTGDLLLTGGKGHIAPPHTPGKIRLWDARTLTVVKELADVSEPLSVMFSHDGARVIAGLTKYDHEAEKLRAGIVVWSIDAPAPKPPPVVENTAAPLSERPNILLVVGSDWSWPHAGAYGNRNIKTPAFDSVAQSGVVFSNAFVTTPGHAASRVSILTGRYPWAMRSGRNCQGSVVPTFPEQLRKEGYITGCQGEGWNIVGNGFDGREPAGTRFDDFEEFLRQRPEDRPFCYCLSGESIRRPYVPGAGKSAGIDPSRLRLPGFLPDTEAVRSDMADYFEAVGRFDQTLQSALRSLSRVGQLDKTIVVVTSDRGMSFPRTRSSLCDKSIHVPLAIMHGDNFRDERRIRDFVSHVDLAPMFLEAGGVLPEFPQRELLAIDRLLYWFCRSDQEGRMLPECRPEVYVGMDWDLDGPSLEPGAYPCRAIRTNSSLLIHNARADRWPADSPERNNVSDTPSRRSLLDTKNADDWSIKLFELAYGRRPEREYYELAEDPYQLHNRFGDGRFGFATEWLGEALDEQFEQVKSDPVGGQFGRRAPAKSVLGLTATPSRENETISDIARRLLPDAASMSLDDFEQWMPPVQIAKGTVRNQSLTLALMRKRSYGVGDDFRYMREAVAPENIVIGILASRLNGRVTMIPPTSITACEAAISKQDKNEAHGWVEFSARNFYEGKVHFKARNTKGEWQIVEFTLPKSTLTLQLHADGAWHRKQDSDNN